MQFETKFRNEEESISSFVVRLKELALLCRYGKLFDERVRDRFAVGVKFPVFEIEVRQRWPDGVNDDGSVVTLLQLLRLAQAMERAQGEIREQAGECTAISAVACNTRNRGTGRKGRDGTEKQRQCKNCELAHSLGQCPASKAHCFKCKKRGHYARCCDMKAVQYLVESETHVGVLQPEEGEFNIQMLGQPTSKAPQAKIEVKLNGYRTRMEFDSGARASVIPRPLWVKIGAPKLHKGRSNFMAYGNNTLDIVGECNVRVEVGGREQVQKVAVINREEVPLFGLPWIIAFDMKLPSVVKIGSVRKEKREGTTAVLGKDPGEAVIREFQDIFQSELGTIKGYQAKIHVKENAVPKAVPARRVPFPMKRRVEQELDRLVGLGILEVVDPAEVPIEWATPTVNVEKPNGEIRICGDFRVTLNPNIVLEQSLLPTFEELTSKLVGGQEFSMIDLKDAYLQLEVCEEHRKFLVIATHKGYFRYKRLPFGVSASPGIFQKYMEKVLAGIRKVGVLIDDIIVTGKDRTEHVAILREVLGRLRSAGLRAKREKCNFFQDSVKYLGHQIDKKGIHPTWEKVHAIRETPSPSNVKQLRSFLGAINFYDKFVPKLHVLCVDLHRLTGTKTKWEWTAREEEAFQKVKMRLSCDDVVVPYDERKPLALVCDASEDGLGCVLMHRLSNGTERPIAFASRTLAAAEKRYANIDREALAMIFGVRKFHQYVWGREFTLVTDHKPLQRIFGTTRDLPKVVNNRLVRWALELNQYQYVVEYRKGAENVCADALSRLPVRETEAITGIKFLNVEKIETLMSFEKLQRESIRDKDICNVKHYLRSAWPQEARESLKLFKTKKEELTVEKDVLMWFGRVVVPTGLRQDTLKILHCGHPGIAAMRAIARYYVWWPHIDQDIDRYVKGCVACQENRENVEEMPLYPWNVPERVWERVHLDLAGPMDGSMWLVGIDALSKWAELEVMARTTSMAIINRLREWFSRNGVPQEIVTDNGPQFVSAEIEVFFRRHNIRHVKTTPYHPRSNGLVERLIRTLKMRYKATTREITNSRLAIQNVLFSYRNAPQQTTGRAPAELFLGRRLPTMLDNLKPNVRKEMEWKIWKQQTRHDGNKRGRSFEEGEEVWVKNERAAGWTAGVVRERKGPYSYEVLCGGVLKRKHADQLRSRVGAVDDTGDSREESASLDTGEM